MCDSILPAVWRSHCSLRSEQGKPPFKHSAADDKVPWQNDRILHFGRNTLQPGADLTHLTPWSRRIIPALHLPCPRERGCLSYLQYPRLASHSGAHDSTGVETCHKVCQSCPEVIDLYMYCPIITDAERAHARCILRTTQSIIMNCRSTNYDDGKSRGNGSKQVPINCIKNFPLALSHL